MEKFEVNVLGCGSATPTVLHNPSCQVINFREKLFMVDCGEGSQLQFKQMKLRSNRMGHIFISHLHGDHCFGLIGFLSTLSLMGRTGEVVIHAPKEAEEIFRPLLNFFCRDISFTVRFNPINTQAQTLIYEDRSITVESIPLIHRMPTAGFLFSEKSRSAHLRGDMAKFYNIPTYKLNDIKAGADYVTPEGVIVPNHRLTLPAEKPLRYAYCSDTYYSERIIPIIEGVDLLYHEATFAEKERARAKETLHSTASQAATIAQKAGVGKLLIGHYSARYTDNRLLLKEAQAIFPQTILSTEGGCYEVKK